MPARQYLTVEDVAKRHRRSPRTVRDWITNGCATPNGRIRLEALRGGQKIQHRIRGPGGFRGAPAPRLQPPPLDLP